MKAFRLFAFLAMAIAATHGKIQEKMGCIVTILLVALLGVSAMNHSVGGPSGWDLSSNVQVWSAAHRFRVGDNLVFVCSSVHNILEVNKPDYFKCHTTKPMNIDNSGNTVVRLTERGTRYFISGRNADCAMGLKLRVDVLPQINETLTGGFGYNFPRTPRRPPPSPIHRPSPSMPDLDLPCLLPPPVIVFPPPGSETASPPEASSSSSGVGGIMMGCCLDSLFATTVVFAINYLFFNGVDLFF